MHRFSVWTLHLIFITLLALGYSSHGYTYQSYQGSVKCTAMGPPVVPGSIEEIQELVLMARKNYLTLKPIGNLHTVTDEICTPGIVVNMSRFNDFYYDPSTQTAKVGPGMIAVDFMENLHSVGRAIYGSPSFGGVTVGGVVSNSVHGTALTKQTTLSDQIASVLIVDGRGDVRRISKSVDEHLFRAVRVGLGLLGIIVEVEFYTVEQYKIHFRNYAVSDNILWRGGEIRKIAKESDLFHFWWFPTNKQIVLSVGTRLPVTEPGTCRTHFISELPKLLANTFSTALEVMQATSDHVGFFLMQTIAKMGIYRVVPARTPFFTEESNETKPCLPEATGYSHRMMSNWCKECPWDQEPFAVKPDDTNIAIPLSELTGALVTIRNIIEESLTQFPLNGIYFRFLTPSDAYMAINYGQEMVSVEWITVQRHKKNQDPKLGLAGYQAMAQALVEKHRGRPHMGKNGLYFHNPDIIRRAHPQIDRFIDAMRELDPDEVFMNSFGRRVKHGSFEMTLTPDLAAHCALNDMCVCREYGDCGNGNLICGKLAHYEFLVCRRRNLLAGVLPDEMVARVLLSALADTINLIDNEDVALKALLDFAMARTSTAPIKQLTQLLSSTLVPPTGLTPILDQSLGRVTGLIG